LRHRPDRFSVLSGDDALTLAVIAHGGDGVISVISNATPNLMRELVARALAEKMTEARHIDNRLRPWMRAAFIESNPIPVKAALGLMDRITPTLRPPLVPLAEAHIPTLVAALVAAGALKA